MDCVDMSYDIVEIPNLENLLKKIHYITNVADITFKIDAFYYENNLCIEIYRDTQLVIYFNRYEDLVKFFNPN